MLHILSSADLLVLQSRLLYSSGEFAMAAATLMATLSDGRVVQMLETSPGKFELPAQGDHATAGSTHYHPNIRDHPHISDGLTGAEIFFFQL